MVNPTDGLTYVWAPPGTFMMGCSAGDSECFGEEMPAHAVTITRGFWLGRTHVTQAAYQRVIGSNPSYFKGENLPVENVGWDVARTYCQAVGGGLPTEAEWEYAARAGSTAARYGDLDRILWYSVNKGGRPHEVGQKQPNAFGLYDMLGNEWQWTADWYEDNYYQTSERLDPAGPSAGRSRAIRGGSWDSLPRFARVSSRSRISPGGRVSVKGFRCVAAAASTAAAVNTSAPSTVEPSIGPKTGKTNRGSFNRRALRPRNPTEVAQRRIPARRLNGVAIAAL